MDPKDLPYSELASNFGGILVYTKDRHLRAMGAERIGVREIVLLRDFARAASPGLSLRIGGALALMIVAAPITSLLKAATRVIARLPVPVQIGLAVAALLAAFHPKSREFVARAVGSPQLGLAKRLLTEYADELTNSVNAVAHEWGAVKNAIPDRRRQPLIAHARAICAAADVPTSEEAIEKGMRQAGYVSRASHFRVYLRRQLRAEARFVEGPKGFWTLTRSAQ